jgi:apolipoprotein N-acyltransferase
MAGSAVLVACAEGSNDRVRALIAVGAAWFTLSQLGVFAAERARAQATDPHGAVKRLLFIQPNFPREYRWDEKMQPLVLDVISTYTRQVLEKTKSIPDVVFWPENLLTDAIDRNRSLNDALMEAVRAIGVPVVTGIVLSGRSDQSQTYRSAALWIDPETGIRDAYEKAIAVPVLESTLDAPLSRLLSRVIGVGAQLQGVVEAESAAPLRGDFEVGILLCYESLFPQAARDRRGSETLALVNLADDSWIENARPTRQLTTFSVYRAIEQRLPFIRVAHGGLSAAYDEYGREIRSAPLDEFASFSVDVTPTPPAGAVERIAIASALLLPGIAAWLAWPWVYAWLRKTRVSFCDPPTER